MAPKVDLMITDAESLRTLMISLLGKLYGDQNQLAANLTFLIIHQYGSSINSNHLHLVLSRTPDVHYRGWKLVLLYANGIVVEGLQGERKNVLDLLLKASADAIRGKVPGLK
ncbi:uncharacterized protein K460DRAFT_352127 [Cucurbitaria berberidis CBS 394.84]|uniref:Uncharacterized protein n=1 Tax=Cucurbitaria berberidis CBS 394.84 TaxID=1168544 RepID=A0A9P4GJW7_9PLEO|nr:uncharacterized protein K460DRAFT_352127 [Cucurbitaria berberidis CBS 394.84]KAF1846930.1 hypothetical protein K460DRAFT_352127 [Cucurbitaria berberidis CBS 394.84]